MSQQVMTCIFLRLPNPGNTKSSMLVESLSERGAVGVASISPRYNHARKVFASTAHVLCLHSTAH